MGRRTTAVLALLVGLFSAEPASAAVFNVNTTIDAAGAGCPSICTLRAAVQAAQGPGSPEADTINVPAGDYVLTAGSLSVGTTQTITIVGDGADRTTIRPFTSGRALIVGGESRLTIRGVTFANGNVTGDDAAGGNILANSATLFMFNVRITGGRAQRGGGIASNGGVLAFAYSLVDGNQVVAGGSGDGGGILSYNGSTLLMVDSTVTGNTALTGGGIALNGNEADATTLTRVTLAHNTSTNSAGGGLASFNASRLADISGTIVAGNLGHPTRLGGLVPSNCGGDLPVNVGGNLESGTDCNFSGNGSVQAPSATGLAPALVSDGGPTPTLPITADSPARDLVGACTGTDQRGVARPQGALCDAGAYEYVQPPPPQATPTPTPAATPVPTATPTPTPPVPVFHQTVVVGKVSGTILVRRPGSSKFEELDATAAIPLGSTVDAKRGVVVLTSVPKAGGVPETAKFWDGIFKLSQPGSITQLALTEPLAPCAKRARASAAKPKSRRLWGDGKGKFRTKGTYSAATVRGTKWLVQDSCAGTLTRVTKGVVTVRHGRKTVLVRAGKRYLAKAKR